MDFVSLTLISWQKLGSGCFPNHPPHCFLPVSAFSLITRLPLLAWWLLKKVSWTRWNLYVQTLSSSLTAQFLLLSKWGEKLHRWAEGVMCRLANVSAVWQNAFLSVQVLENEVQFHIWFVKISIDKILYGFLECSHSWIRKCTAFNLRSQCFIPVNPEDSTILWSSCLLAARRTVSGALTSRWPEGKAAEM